MQNFEQIRKHTTIQFKPGQSSEHWSMITALLRLCLRVLSPASCCTCRKWSLNSKDNRCSLADRFLFFFYLLMQGVPKRWRNTEFMYLNHCVFVWSWSVSDCSAGPTESRTACKQKNWIRWQKTFSGRLLCESACVDSFVLFVWTKCFCDDDT